MKGYKVDLLTGKSDPFENAFNVYTDGSFKYLEGISGAGIYFCGSNHQLKLALSLAYKKVANDPFDTEMIPIALAAVAMLQYLKNKEIHFFSDCQGGLAKLEKMQKKKPGKNGPTREWAVLAAYVLNKLSSNNKVHLHWIPRKLNQIADKLADYEFNSKDKIFDQMDGQIKYAIVEGGSSWDQMVHCKWTKSIVVTDGIEEKSFEETMSLRMAIETEMLLDEIQTIADGQIKLALNEERGEFVFNAAMLVAAAVAVMVPLIFIWNNVM